MAAVVAGGAGVAGAGAASVVEGLGVAKGVVETGPWD